MKSVGRIITSILFFIFLVIFIISGFKIFNWITDSKKTNQQIESVQKIAGVSKNSEFIKENFNDLKNTNPDTIGWVQVKGTNINYPFVKASDNLYYLTHSFDKSYNEAGWVFLDYRNDSILTENKNTILYAHNRLDKTMFGSLTEVLKNNWLEDKNNHIIKISTKSENSLWQTFSAYRIATTSDYLKIKFNDDSQYLDFINKLIERSVYNFNVPLKSTDNILTLSTCYNDAEKFVVHAKLISVERKF